MLIIQSVIIQGISNVLIGVCCHMTVRAWLEPFSHLERLRSIFVTRLMFFYPTHCYRLKLDSSMSSHFFGIHDAMLR